MFDASLNFAPELAHSPHLSPGLSVRVCVEVLHTRSCLVITTAGAGAVGCSAALPSACSTSWRGFQENPGLGTDPGWEEGGDLSSQVLAVALFLWMSLGPPGRNSPELLDLPSAQLPTPGHCRVFPPACRRQEGSEATGVSQMLSRRRLRTPRQMAVRALAVAECPGRILVTFQSSLVFDFLFCTLSSFFTVIYGENKL